MSINRKTTEENGIERTELSSPWDIPDSPTRPERVDRKEEEEDDDPPKPSGESEEEVDSDPPDPPRPDEDDDDDPEGAGDGGKPETDDDDDDDPGAQTDWAVIGQYWKEEGHLPEDAEITEDITEEKLEEMYRNHKDEIAEQEREQRYKEKGYTEEHLEKARLLSKGINPQDIIDTDRYDHLGSVQIPEGEDGQEAAAQLLAIYYQQEKELGKSKTDDLIEKAVEKGTLTEDVKEAQEYFAEKAEVRKEQMKEAAKQREKEKEKKHKNWINRIKSAIDNKKVADMDITEEQAKYANKVLFKKTETITTKDGTYRVTPYEKKKYEESQDPDMRLKRLFQFILDIDEKAIEEKAEKKSTKRILRGLNGGGVNKGGGNSSQETDDEKKERKSKIKRKALPAQNQPLF